MITFNQISKSYHAKTPWWSRHKQPAVFANNNVSFECHPGQIHGLLGVNGAGKSTALKMLAGLIQPDSGSVSVADIDVSGHRIAAQQQMGIFLSSDGLYPKLTARENIALFAACQGVADSESATDSIIDELHLRAIAERQVEGFSTGQRMKVALARALVHQPKYVILDEPTRGLDVMSIRLLRDYLLQLKARGCCVLFSSHVMQEVDKLCDKVTVIHDGKVQFSGDLTVLRAQDSAQDLEQAFIQVVGA